ncbi:MAG: LytTR family transcriptional regulator, partial [Bacteroidales bacterium]|nr:LytTR family transcriptional regulator [Bacteroidales bacterium]
MNLLNYLNQPFPKAESKWKTIISISLFVALFLIIFQPFDINHFQGNNKLLFLSGYGLVTFCALVFDLIIIEDIFKKFFNDRNWKIWKEFVTLIWVIFTIGLGNALYTSFVFGFYFEEGFSFFLQFQLATLIVGIFPITVLIITKQKFLLSKHLNSAKALNKNIDKTRTEINTNNTILFFADNEKDSIEFSVSKFLFIESSGNYIELYLFEDEKIIRKTFRSTLKRSLDFFKDCPEIIQCHRAFIVNTSKIKSANGNSQGLRLSIKNCNTEVPVSRGFVNDVK